MCSKSNRIVSRGMPSRRPGARLLLVAACVLWAAAAVQAGLPDGLAAYYRFNAAFGIDRRR